MKAKYMMPIIGTYMFIVAASTAIAMGGVAIMTHTPEGKVKEAKDRIKQKNDVIIIDFKKELKKTQRRQKKEQKIQSRYY